MKKEVHRERLGSTAFVAVVCLVGIAMMFIMSCSEEAEEPITLMTEGATGPLAKMKVPTQAETPAAPQMQIPEGTPTVTSVGYYSDWKLTKKLTGTVSAGKTIFIQVVFSEGMKLVVADDKTARPILYYRKAGKLTRFRIVKFGAGGKDFVSGDAKPIKTQATYLCKYVVQKEDKGQFVFAVGKFSVDKEGNTLPAFYTHKEKLQLGTTTPTVTSVGYYSDWQATKPLTGTVKSGSTIYTKIIFSEEMEEVVSDGNKARPILYYRIGDRDIQHNIVPQDAQGKHYASGDTKPIKNHATYLGKYRVSSSDYGTFTLVVGKDSASKKGIKLADEYVHTESLQMPEPPAPVVTVIGAPSGIDNSDTVLVTTGGKGATHYKYSVGAGEECGEYGEPIPIHRRLTADVSKLPDGTVTLCVLGKNIAGVWQTKPTTVQWTRDSSAVPEPTVGDIESAGTATVTPNLTETKIPGTQDFVGRVYTPKLLEYGYTRSDILPVKSATVTVTSGSKFGKKVITDQDGQYIFPNIEGDELHLRVEKSGFEPKEVIVYRFAPTVLSNGMKSNFPGDPQHTPGNILIGHRWPDEVRFILQQTLVIHDLLYIDGGSPTSRLVGGFYRSGVVVVFTNRVARSHGRSGVLGTIAHEIAHAHQHALVSRDGSGDIWKWANTSEAVAFAEAQKKDWVEVGKAPYDTIPGYDTLDENAAETSAHYWSVDRWGGRTAYGNLRVEAPNRFKWAQQWLR